MKFTLKDYQADAVAEVLQRLDQARDAYRGKYASRSAFSLSATTGAGKTVMAAAVIEALFNGNDDYRIEPDPGAVVLWFTDDPSLNEQTRFRLLEASDLPHSRLRVIQPDFHAERLEPGCVYFLNSQKLSKRSLLVRGAEEDVDERLPGTPAAPDLRANTMWDILRNTIEDERLTLYLVLDEAHKGMKPPSSRDRAEKQTIVRRLINGNGRSPAMPIVWGISATVKRFEEAMTDAADRATLPSVVVDVARVQESGLLKDDIRLEFPAEAGQFDTTLLARAVRRVREASTEWAAYAKTQDPAIAPVVPLLVVQLPNKPSDELLLDAFRTVAQHWPDLPHDALAHVFGDHSTLDLGGHVVPHVAPEKVEEQTWIRVLFAKDAISTGWDCPRAEVLVSFRPAAEETHITQLLGRMVRTPLARRVPGNDLLNSVECLLPRFNEATATLVAQRLMSTGDEAGREPAGSTGRRVIHGPVELRPNGEVPEAVWDVFDTLPSQTLPRRVVRPVRRLLALAQALSQDGLRVGARRSAYEELCAVLDGLAARYRQQFEHEVSDVGTMSGSTLVATRSGLLDAGGFEEIADRRAVDSEFRAASRILTRDVALRYAEHLAGDDDDLVDAHLRVAALARVPEVGEALDREAIALSDSWFVHHRVAIRGLSHDRQAAYDDIRAMAALPQRVDVMRPDVRLEASLTLAGDKVPTARRHLMSDGKGNAPVGELNSWELNVLEAESNRPDFLAWYRNPSRGGVDSLSIAYENAAGVWKRMCPDFVFFHGDESHVWPSIVDPHGAHLGDALPKLRGLAAYAEEYGDGYQRIEAIAEVDGVMSVLDMKLTEVRDAVRSADDALALYRSSAAVPYDV